MESESEQCDSFEERNQYFYTVSQPKGQPLTWT